MNAAEYRREAERAMNPPVGFRKPQPEQVDRARVWALLAVPAATSEATEAAQPRAQSNREGDPS